MKTIRQEVRVYAEAMEDQLQANDHKSGWQSDSHSALLDRLREETIELEDAISSGEVENIIKEAADVGNFAMMIIDNARRRATER